MVEAYIVDHCRTPRGIGKVGKGALAHLHPQYLGATVLKALSDRNGIDTSKVDDVIWGCSNQQAKQASDLGRMTALAAGYDVRASGVTLDRFCGSGLTATIFGAATIMAGMEDVVIAGGCEMMSHNAADPRARRTTLMDADNLHLRELHPQVGQGICADAIATIEGISRLALEEFAVESQRRADHAMRHGYFSRSLVPVVNEDGSLALDRDEHPRPNTTLQGLAGLNPAFEAGAAIDIDENGTTQLDLIRRALPDLEISFVHHAGTSSGVVDGAAAILLASPDAVARNGWKARARIVATANVGDSPELMLNAPVPAAQKVLAKAGLTLDDIDLFEVNEAFAVVTEKFIRDLKIDRDRINVNGGAIALGHPIGATGAILVGTLLDELERRDLKRGLVTMCAAGGMAPALVIERI
ncbi:acetyl-CoA acetyltransferase [Thalassospira profundimaris]|uniref:Acetyl-CoA acetyltransferase n=1 Tax=Thalassospira profundimaris TaxID=502049 RepID=A0A367WHV8_9PROT|nr:acetyl-CoA C-acetyltransferase [Thalassospira profundimaris]RCK41004.1 acetyl-CoA acetyltransferase [Thalassospira profundimaris]